MTKSSTERAGPVLSHLSFPPALDQMIWPAAELETVVMVQMYGPWGETLPTPGYLISALDVHVVGVSPQASISM